MANFEQNEVSGVFGGVSFGNQEIESQPENAGTIRKLQWCI